MQGGDSNRIQVIRSDKDTHFTGALAQNAREDESIALPAQWRTTECVVEGIAVISDQNLEWDVYLFSSSAFSNSNMDLDMFADCTNFPSTSGKQIAGAGSYYYPSPSGIQLPYKSADSSIHIALVNRSATGKNAGATGEVVVLVYVRPVTGIGG